MQYPGLDCREKRIAIVNNVLENFDTYRFARGIMISGLHAVSPAERPYASTPVNESLVAKLKDNGTVCLLGALLLSRIELCQNVEWGRLGACNRSILYDAWTLEELFSMEAAFELWDGLDNEHASWFGRMYSDNRDRARAILENIIANDGDFKPGTMSPVAS